MKLSRQQVDFFNVFGFLKLPGLFREDIQAVTEQFEQVLQAYEKVMGAHDGTKRLMVPCVDSSYYLSGLLDDPRIVGAASSLLGDDFNYWGSDGNYYTGDTGWHPDGNEPKYLHIKLAFYLDELNGENGALRVIPGSHRETDRYAFDLMRTLRSPEEHFGLHGSEIPAQVLDVVPGDLLIFNHRTLHSAWGGGTKRRMFTMNMCERYKEEDLGFLRKMILPHVGANVSRYYGDAMLETAGPERMKHLEQLIHLWDWDAVTKDKPAFQYLKI
ncbi:phytanoyl-CoA dioxygenase family protein [Paenibacillus lycopersici]|uniref:Phytanoyl-CoA dioxygenase family protein n=1 Tax=Paenibacillus lycopersici TaxID=2704462 RepID=A0A6C0FU44_9BACL|nr:phytanoyl-CoA dioxygenase family protein [Paenibacillus lycopersici]QHT58844.1 phytanoyl-CoA dioxygenase family protein [Paenibacillus lycopersici]